MIKVTIFNTIAEIQISGKPDEFNADLTEIKSSISREDRKFDKDRGAWIVRSYEKYEHLPYIKAAMQDRMRQPELF